MTDIVPDGERQRFEAWAPTVWLFADFSRGGRGQYLDPVIEIGWQTWQTALARLDGFHAGWGPAAAQPLDLSRLAAAPAPTETAKPKIGGIEQQLWLRHLAMAFNTIYDCVEKGHYDEALLHAGSWSAKVQKIAAAPAPTETAGDAETSRSLPMRPVWLIERTDVTPPLWLKSIDGAVWVENAADARYWWTDEEANHARETLGTDDYYRSTVTEHSFIAAAPACDSPVVAETLSEEELASFHHTLVMGNQMKRDSIIRELYQRGRLDGLRGTMTENDAVALLGKLGWFLGAPGTVTVAARPAASTTDAADVLAKCLEICEMNNAVYSIAMIEDYFREHPIATPRADPQE
jgi:hypothetical protein